MESAQPSYEVVHFSNFTEEYRRFESLVKLCKSIQ